MKRIHHILSMLLLSTLCAITLIGYGKGSGDEEDRATSSSKKRKGEKKHPAVVAFGQFVEAIAQKDFDRMCEFMPENVQKRAKKAKKELSPKEYWKNSPKFGTVQSVLEIEEDEVLIVCEAEMGPESGLADVTMKQENGKWIIEDIDRHKTPEERRQQICANSLKQVALSLYIYANDYDDFLPNSLDEIDYAEMPRSCTCDGKTVPYVLQPEVAGKTMTVILAAGNAPAKTPMVVCRNHQGAEVVAYLDGHVGVVHKESRATGDDTAPTEGKSKGRRKHPASGKGKKGEHPAVVAFKGFAKAVAEKDIDKMFDYLPAKMQGRKEEANEKVFDSLPSFGEIKSVEEKGEDEVLIVCEVKEGPESGLADVMVKKENGKWVIADMGEHEENGGSPKKMCFDNLKQVALNLIMYSCDHDVLPNSLDEIDDAEMPRSCTCDGKTAPYVLLPEWAGKDPIECVHPSTTPFVVCRNHENCEVVAYLDGHVEIHEK